MSEKKWIIHDESIDPGPYSDRDLRDLANRSLITPETILSTKNDQARQRKAGTIKGLFNQSEKNQSDKSRRQTERSNDTATFESRSTIQTRHWFFSTPWWPITSLMFVPMFLSLGLDSLSIYWSNSIPNDSIWTTIVGLFGIVGALTGVTAMIVSSLRKMGLGKQFKAPVRLKYAAWALGGSFLFAMLGIMVPMFHVATLNVRHVAEQESATRALTEPWVTHQLPNNFFRLNAPSNWKIQGTEADSLQMADSFNGLLLAAYSTPKVDSMAKSISDLQAIQVNNLKANGATVERVETGQITTVSSHTFQDMVIEMGIQAEKHIALVRHFDFGEFWVVVYFQLRPSKFESNIGTLRQIADSVQRSPGS